MDTSLNEFVCNSPNKLNSNIVEYLNLDESQEWNLVLVNNKILILLEGSLEFSLGEFSQKTMFDKTMLMIPAGYHFSARAISKVKLIVMRMDVQSQFCDCYSFNNLSSEKDQSVSSDISCLNFTQELTQFIDSLTMYLNDGVKCSYLYQLKIKEFLFLLRTYYKSEDLYSFFYMYLTNNTSFSDYVYKNYKKVKTVEEFAKLSNYSISGFQKRFKRVFGTSAYQWMKEQRSRNILHEINNTKKSFKEISDDFGFYSPSHFNDFCKMQFGTTPGVIRKNGYDFKKQC